jgi:hypothetical protein
MFSTHMRYAGAAIAIGVAIGGCDASDNTIDPGDLELRDLLGFDPAVAATWDIEQRAAARTVFERGLAAPADPAQERLGLGIEIDERVALSLLEIDDWRADADAGALGLVHVRVADQLLDASPLTFGIADAPPPSGLELRSATPAWDGRGAALLATMAVEAGHPGGQLDVVPVARLAVVVAYVEPVESEGHAGADGRPHLLVNPVLLASLEDSPDDEALAPVSATVGGGGGGSVSAPVARRPKAPGGPGGAGGIAEPANPYSFYGSIGECAYAEELRCDGCLPDDCVAQTVDGDGNDECTTFAATVDGYSLWCVNLAVAISGVEACLAERASSCDVDVAAVRTLDDLADNATVLADATCAAALDACLADLYGESEGTYPPPAGEDPVPPRDTSVGCGDSSSNCSFDPSCKASGPSCNNSLSCDGACADSSSQGGCGGTCDSCQSGGGGGATCLSCDSDSGGGSASDTGCGSCGSSGSSGTGGDACGSCSDSSSSGGDACGSCSDSSGSSCGGDSCGSGSCGSDNSSSCSVVKQRRQTGMITVLLQIVWALTPIPAAAWMRRRARRKKRDEDEPSDEEVSP